MTTLYPDQLLAAEKCEDWLNNTLITCAGLWASAGYGKSYTTSYLIEEVILKNTNYVPVLTSMTHSAVGVLAGFTGREVTTLHSFMKWIPQKDKETGEEYISTPLMRDKNAEDILKKGMILIVDEAGMLGHTEDKLLMDEARRCGARILKIGDHKQCFPIFKEGEEECVPAYKSTQLYLHLTEPKRVDKSDMIYKLSTKARLCVDGAPQPELKTALNPDGSGKGVRHVDDIEEMAYTAFRAGIRDGNTRNIKVLAFTNIRCLNLNRKIRKKVMGYKDPTPVVGEEMIANTSITKSSDSNEVLIRNNQLVIVKEVEKTESYGMPGAFILFEDLDGNELEEIVFVPDSPAKLHERLKKMSAEARGLKGNGFDSEASLIWRAFYSLKESVADIRFTYAVTVNKAQGCTLKHALVDLVDINTCQSKEQKARLTYTAYTRPTDFLTIEGNLDG